MAKKKKSPELDYVIADYVLRTPRRMRIDGIWVGVGGSITIKVKPPGNDVVIPEATPEQYMKIAKMNNKLVTLK